MKILIVGAGGQLGWELLRTAPTGWQVVGLDRQQLDITRQEEVEKHVAALRPHWLINAAAYTAVDRAESHPAEAEAVNGAGTGHLCRAVDQYGGRLLHVSTDYVFDGRRGLPWRTNELLSPLGEYGRSKAKGEGVVREVLAEHFLIVRTAWLYSCHGSNFVHTMLRLMRERQEISVVMDQVGSPTWACHLAQALWGLIGAEARGVYHWSNAGVASWYDFAIAIRQIGLSLGLLSKKVDIHPIASESYPTPAPRPAYSVLDCRESWAILGKSAPHWMAALELMLQEVKG